MQRTKIALQMPLLLQVYYVDKFKSGCIAENASTEVQYYSDFKLRFHSRIVQRLELHLF